LGIDFNAEWVFDVSVNTAPRTERPAGYRAGRSALRTPRTAQREIAPCVSTRVTVGYSKLTGWTGQYQHPITTARNADVAVYGRNVNRENQRRGAVAPLTYVGKRGIALRTYTWRGGQQVSGINR
jgi:hypothetical protein